MNKQNDGSGIGARHKKRVTKIKVGNITVKIYFDRHGGGKRKAFRVQWDNPDGTIGREMFATYEEAWVFADKTATDLNNKERLYTREEIDRVFELEARIKQLELQLAPHRPDGVEQVVTDVVAAHEALPGWTVPQMAHEIRKRHSTIKQYLIVPKVVEAFVKHFESGFKRQYSKCYLCQIRKYSREFAVKFETRRIDLVSPQEVLDFVTGYRVQPIHKHKGRPLEADGKLPANPKTRDSVYNTLRRIFDHARDVLQALPADERTAAERVERPDATRNKPEVYLPREVLAMFGIFPDIEMILLAAVQVFAGLRICEALRLTDADFQRDEAGNYKTVIVRYGKKSPHGDGGYRTRPAPITPPLAALLNQITLPEGPLFKRFRLERYVTEYARLAGVTWKHNALRHTFVSYRLLAVPDRNQVAHEAGHTVTVQLDNYEGLVNVAHVKLFWAFIPSVKDLPWRADIPDIKTLMRQVAKRNEQAGQKPQPTNPAN